MRLGWITDVHLNFVPVLQRTEFYAQLREKKLDALLLGGDIGEADSVAKFLAEMADTLAFQFGGLTKRPSGPADTPRVIA